ncbi:MAG: hypothetical protein WCF95_03620 [bacterium]
MRVQPTQKRNFDESRTRLARSSAECCNPKGLQNGAKSFELSNISRQQNFGAIKITPKQTPQILHLEKTDKMAADNEANLALIDVDALHLISKIIEPFNALISLGENNGRKCWNILTKQDSPIEKTILKQLSDAFEQKRIYFEAASILDKEAGIAEKAHKGTMDDLYINHMHKKNPNV